MEGMFSFKGNFVSEDQKPGLNDANMKVSDVSSVNNIEDESISESQYTEADEMPRDTTESRRSFS